MLETEYQRKKTNSKNVNSRLQEYVLNM